MDREWTKYSDSSEPPSAGPGKKKRRGAASKIRARKNTQMIQNPGVLELTFTGENPGIAMDLRGETELTKGPYKVVFELTGSWKGSGEIFYTTNAQSILPKGEVVKFEITGSDEEQKICVDLKTEKVLNQIRIDVADGAGSAMIKNLRLLSRDGGVLKDWTP